MNYDKETLSSTIDAAILSLVSIADQMKALDYDDDRSDAILRLAVDLRGLTSAS